MIGDRSAFMLKIIIGNITDIMCAVCVYLFWIEEIEVKLKARLNQSKFVRSLDMEEESTSRQIVVVENRFSNGLFERSTDCLW